MKKQEPIKPQDLDFETWQELYEYILESKINGQHKQSKGLYKSLALCHKENFEEWLHELVFVDGMTLNVSEEKQEEFSELIKYYKLN
jgi:hypothetical protein